MTNLEKAAQFFFSGAPNKKVCMYTDAEAAISSNYVYLHYYTTSVPCPDYIWNEFRQMVTERFTNTTESVYLTPRRKTIAERYVCLNH